MPGGRSDPGHLTHRARDSTGRFKNRIILTQYERVQVLADYKFYAFINPLLRALKERRSVTFGSVSPHIDAPPLALDTRSTHTYIFTACGRKTNRWHCEKGR